LAALLRLHFPVSLRRPGGSRVHRQEGTLNQIASVSCDSDISVGGQVLRSLRDLDGLLKSTAMSAASMIPGFAGVAAAAATVTFDLSQRFWIGAILSGSSMIPLIGYLPGGCKIVWNIRAINKCLGQIEGLLPEIATVPSLVSKVIEVTTKHYDRVRRVPMATNISSKLSRIIQFCEEHRQGALSEGQSY